MKKSIIASLSGNILEWYDFGLFLYLAPILSRQFFPTQAHSPLLTTFVVFAAGFIMRPLGALLFGHIGDRLGRALTLRLSIGFVSLLAFAVAILPGYEQVGVAAVVCIMILRLLQGLCLGGEFAGSMVYLSELAPKHKALMSSLANNGSNVGLLLATATIALLNWMFGAVTFAAWGWRLGFALGGVLGISGLCFRWRFAETQTFNDAKVQQRCVRLPAKVLWQQHRKRLLFALGLMCMTTSGCYTFMNLLSTYCHEVLHWSLSESVLTQSLYLTASLVLIPLAALIADRYGVLPSLRIAAIGYIALSLPCYFLLNQTHMAWTLIPVLICFCLEQGAMPVTLAQLFPVEVRYSAVSFAYNLNVAIVGSTAPVINLYLIEHWHKPWLIAWHLMVSAAIALTVLILLIEKKTYTGKVYQ